jgi:hypothetical protein
MLPGFAADWPAPGNVRSWQTLRAGGVSAGAYAALNLGAHVHDDSAAVTRNRALLVEGLALPAEPAWLRQVHGTDIADLDQVHDRAADGAVTATPGHIAVIMTADCLPVLLCDRAGTRVGAAHAGWRGLAAGVLPAAVAALGVSPDRVLAWLGPAIGPSAFEVGEEVRDAFLQGDDGAGPAFRRNVRGRWQADLYELARRSLAAAGVGSVFGGGYCTYREPARFFSHRREAPCGRQATLVWLE